MTPKFKVIPVYGPVTSAGLEETLTELETTAKGEVLSVFQPHGDSHTVFVVLRKHEQEK